MSRMKFFVFAWVLAFGAVGCTAPNAASESIADIETVDLEDVEASKLELARQPEIFDAELINDVRFLQAALFIDAEAAIVVCMKSEGFEYVARDRNVFLEFANMDPVPDLSNGIAEQAIEHLRFQANPAQRPTPDEPTVAQPVKYHLALQSCSSEEMQARPHPFADETMWDVTVQAEASERSAADARVIEALENETTCEITMFGARYSDAVNAVVDEVISDQMAVDAGEMTQADGMVQLERLANEERGLAAAAAPCTYERMAVAKTVYIDYVAEITEREQRRAELFLLELRTTIDSHQSIIDDLSDAG